MKMFSDFYVHNYLSELRREIDLSVLSYFENNTTNLNELSSQQDQWINMIEALKSYEKECQFNLNNNDNNNEPKRLFMNRIAFYLSEQNSIGRLIFIQSQYFTEDCIQLIKQRYISLLNKSFITMF
jgi:hypothetical protein